MVTMNASVKIIRPECFPVVLFSLTAPNNDNDRSKTAKKKNRPLLSGIQWPAAKLPKPKLARTSGTCQQKAKIVAEKIAPKLLATLLLIGSPINDIVFEVNRVS